MTRHIKKYNVLRLISMALLTGSLTWTLCRAQDLRDQPALHLENSTVVPHGNTISCYGVAVTGLGKGSDLGEVKNYDIELHLTLGADGTPHADEIKMAPSPVIAPDTHHFLPGVYVSVANNSGTVTVTGPVLAPGGREVWTYITKNLGGLQSGTWTTGPVERHPQLQSLPKDVVLPKNLTFGVDTYAGLIGVQALGDKLLIATITKLRDSEPVQYAVDSSSIVQRRPPPPN